jgi:hypothetical protein
MSRARIGRFALALVLTLACVGAAACTTFSSAPTPDDAAPPIVVRDAQVPALTDAAVDAVVAPQDGSTDARVDAAPKRYVVFVTSQTIEGKFAGDAGPTTLADAFCLEKANALGGGSKWKAWLMAGNQLPAVRLRDVPGGWVDVNGNEVAIDRVALSGSLTNPPHLDETKKLASGEVWTGIRGDTCGEWTGKDQGDVGVVGDARQWTNSEDNRPCSNRYRLYCFEQAP